MLLAVGLSAALWGALHSLLIAPAVERRLPAALGPRLAWFRLLYNLFALISLVALLLWWRSLPERVLFSWPGWWQVVRWGGLLVAAGLFVAGALAYEGVDFTGWRTARRARRARGPLPDEPASPPGFRRAGILAHVRHPWYSGTILFFLCCLPWTDVNLVWRAVFIGYTVVGTVLEERKLLARLGPAYRAYAREVPMYVPRPRSFRRRR